VPPFAGITAVQVQRVAGFPASQPRNIGAPLSLENQYLLFGDFTHLPAENKSNPAPVRKFPFPYRPCN
jgi:hypothetical protein